MHGSTRTATRTVALAAALLLGLTGSPATAAPAVGADVGTPTAEERRLDRAVPQEILRRSGFAALTPAFGRALASADSYGEARRAVDRHGSALWDRAVDRAQGRGPVRGDLSRDDDRPLYWARLAMSRELRSWQPGFELGGERRARLVELLETVSRGQDSLRFPERDGDRRGAGAPLRILVTGFDPFTLDRDIRISNPSGAAALALDGTVIRTARGPARIETAVFPVRWQDFADGEVERTLGPHLDDIDLLTTISQGRVGRFDVERTNGAWRGGFPDNDNVSRTETVPVAGLTGVQPQWSSSSLPYAAIVAAPTGRFPVRDNTSVTEIPLGGTAAVDRADGPTAGSTARAGGGGNYLSNEIAYRATLLRDRFGPAGLPVGHLHTPVLEFGAGNTDPVTGVVSDPGHVRNRVDIVAQIRTVLTVAVRSSPSP
ncbi:pyroglutamyl peptidase [Streptomyces uncialis]|uniref:pyroglutamyl peptidase n=1 Tax=Streptomyces uncialis TaxID=1048205 RepID=UPI003869696D|nr:pyroglutamyl peptidase [Streptomyces uncialis]